MLAGKYQFVLFYGLVVSFASVSTALFYDYPLILGIPIALAIVYFAFFHLDYLFEFVVLFTPLSLNFEDLGDYGGIGFYMPTEPLLLGITFLVIIRSLVKRRLDKAILSHPLSLAVLLYLGWTFVTCLMSSDIAVSFKFFLSKLWFVVPVFYFGATYFKSTKKIRRFLRLYFISLSIVVVYTMIRHSLYNFGEDQGHWVMTPFFKDHTSYGAVLALMLPVLIGIFFIAKDGAQKFLLGFLVLVYLFGIYFSYTRAAYLSIVGALVLYLLIRYRIKLKYVLTVCLCIAALLIVNKDAIWMDLNKNKNEHATEEFSERIQSMSNVSSDASNLERLNRWACAVEMFKERPVFGFGPGTYAFQYAPFQHHEDLTIISTNFGDGGNAHSEYLGPLAESGLIGMLSFIIVVVVIFYTGIRLYYNLEDPWLKFVILACVLGLFTYFTHGILNNYLDTDKASIPVWGFAAIIVATELRLKKGELEKSAA